MKIVVMTTVVVLLVLAATGHTQTTTTDQSATPPPRVSVALTTVRIRETRSTRADTILVWNRNISSVPIGHAIKTCIKAGTGDILGGGIMNCTLSISLPLGKVVAAGIVHDVSRYTLTITGGTGVYRGTTGPLFVRRVADGARRLTFTVD